MSGAQEGYGKMFSSEYQPPPESKRVKKVQLKGLLEKMLAVEVDGVDPTDGLEKKMSMGKIIAIRLVAQAAKGDLQAIKEVFDRICGKPEIIKDQTSEGFNRVRIEFSGENFVSPQLKPDASEIIDAEGKNADKDIEGHEDSQGEPSDRQEGDL